MNISVGQYSYRCKLRLYFIFDIYVFESLTHEVIVNWPKIRESEYTKTHKDLILINFIKLEILGMWKTIFFVY